VSTTPTVFNKLILASPDFSQGYALAISSIFKYTDQKAYTVFNSRLLTANSETTDGILDINTRIKAAKDKLMGYVCNNTISSISARTISTPAFDV
jgi:hypothetical protein